MSTHHYWKNLPIHVFDMEILQLQSCDFVPDQIR